MRHNIILSCLGLAISITSATSPYLIGSSINLYLSQDSSYIFTISTACLLIITAPILRLSANIYLHQISSKTRSILKKKLLRHLLISDSSNTRNSGEIIDLIDGDVDSALYLYHAVFLDITINSTLIILSLLIITYHYPFMIFAPLSGMAFALLIYFITPKKSDAIYTQYVTENTTTIGTICDLLTLSKTRTHTETLRSNIDKINKLALHSSFKASMFEALSGSCYLLAMGILFLTALYATNNNIMNSGAIFASAIYIERVLSPTTSLISIYYSTREASYRRRRILSLEP